MRLSSQNSQFVFNLPADFLPTEILETYTPILEKNWIQYENIIDYINSTIKSVNFPGLNFDMPKQIMMRGKERQFKPSKNNQDIVLALLGTMYASAGNTELSIVPKDAAQAQKLKGLGFTPQPGGNYVFLAPGQTKAQAQGFIK